MNVTQQVEQHPSGLWVPGTINVNRLVKTVKTVTLPSGERAKVTVEPTGHDGSQVVHIERDEGIDAVVRPKAVAYQLRVRSA